MVENIIRIIAILIIAFLIGLNVGTRANLDYYKRKCAVAAPYQEYCEKFWKEKQFNEFKAWKELEGKNKWVKFEYLKIYYLLQKRLLKGDYMK